LRGGLVDGALTAADGADDLFQIEFVPRSSASTAGFWAVRLDGKAGGTRAQAPAMTGTLARSA